MSRIRTRRQVAAALVALSMVAVGCGSDDEAGTAEGSTTTSADAGAPTVELGADAELAVATTYADLVHRSYADLLAATTGMRSAIESFVASPSEDTLEAAQESWLAARDLYGPTEAFRFYDGPIDDPDDGPEGQINAWPMDEAYVDYVEGDEAAGIVNDAAGVPEITREVVVAANEEGGETNISTGWHAIEFLLWGQDLSEDGPGARPVADYTTSPTAERRATYLTTVTDLLVDDLTAVAAEWDPEGGAYRTTFLEDPAQAVADIMRGMGALSAGELAGERIAVAYETKEQEDEHSCFSDNTMADVVNNARGIRLAYTAELDGVEGTSLSAAIAEADPELDAALREQLDATVQMAEDLAALGTFEAVIRSDDDAEGRILMLDLVEALQAQGDAIAELGATFGYSVSLEI